MVLLVVQPLTTSHSSQFRVSTVHVGRNARKREARERKRTEGRRGRPTSVRIKRSWASIIINQDVNNEGTDGPESKRRGGRDKGGQRNTAAIESWSASATMLDGRRGATRDLATAINVSTPRDRDLSPSPVERVWFYIVIYFNGPCNRINIYDRAVKFYVSFAFSATVCPRELIISRVDSNLPVTWMLAVRAFAYCWLVVIFKNRTTRFRWFYYREFFDILYCRCSMNHTIARNTRCFSRYIDNSVISSLKPHLWIFYFSILKMITTRANS